MLLKQYVYIEQHLHSQKMMTLWIFFLGILWQWRFLEVFRLLDSVEFAAGIIFAYLHRARRTDARFCLTPSICFPMRRWRRQLREAWQKGISRCLWGARIHVEADRGLILRWLLDTKRFAASVNAAFDLHLYIVLGPLWWRCIFDDITGVPENGWQAKWWESSACGHLPFGIG